MARTSKRSAESTGVARTRKAGASATARSLSLARRGVDTATQFKGLMSALMSDVIEGKVAPQIVNAACNAGGKLLKTVELERRFAPRASEAGAALSLTR